MNYRSTVHPSTNRSPANLIFGREIKTCIPVINQNIFGREIKTCIHVINQNILDPEVKDINNKYCEKMKKYFDRNNRVADCDLKIGDSVLLEQEKQNKLSTRFETKEYRVVKRKGNTVSNCGDEGKGKMKNVREVKRFIGGRSKGEHDRKDIYPSRIEQEEDVAGAEEDIADAEEDIADVEEDIAGAEVEVVGQRRGGKVRRPPQYLSNYVTNNVNKKKKKKK